jgi:hypothetical protein
MTCLGFKEFFQDRNRSDEKSENLKSNNDIYNVEFDLEP